MRQALLVIDVQNDFVTGSLAVPDSQTIAKLVNDKIASQHWDLVVASQDFHPQNHVSFASAHQQGPFTAFTLNSGSKTFKTTLWPDHCVEHTFGAEFVSGLNTGAFDLVIRKGEQPETEFYSSFSDVFHQENTLLLETLQNSGIKRVVVVGLALDFCVMHTALDAVQAGFETTVDLSCTRAITNEGGEAAIKLLSASGVSLHV